MGTDWGQIFDHHGLKVVTHTDKSKSAYVLSKDQLRAVLAAGIRPAATRPGVPFEITLILEPRKSVKATFYNSQRVGAHRLPEPRIGREFITTWLQVGDQVVVGSIGHQLYAAKVAGEPATLGIAESVAERADSVTRAKMVAKAKQAGGLPARRIVSRSEFVRSPFIVMGVIARADGKCEMPGCKAEIFLRDDNLPYLEVHHVVPLAEGGPDTFSNAAALCPRCHRQLHHGKERLQLRGYLAVYVASL